MKMWKKTLMALMLVLGLVGFAQGLELDYRPSPVTCVEHALLDSLNVDKHIRVIGYITCDSLDVNTIVVDSLLVITIEVSNKVKTDTLASYSDGQITITDDAVFDSTATIAGDVIIERTTGGGIQITVVDADSLDDAVLSLQHGRGTIASPTATQDGDQLGSVEFGGYGTSWILGAEMRVFATDTWSASENPAKIEIWTTPDDSTSPELAVTIEDNGQVTLEETLNLKSDLLFNAATHNIGDATNHVDTLFVSTITPASVLDVTDSVSVKGNIAGTYIGGITEANLLDKVADETVSGRYSFSDLTTFSDTVMVDDEFLFTSDNTNDIGSSTANRPRNVYTSGTYAGLARLVIGVEWNQGTDTWRHIDEDANTLTLTSIDFDKHPTWGGMRRCNMADDGTVKCYRGDPDFVYTGVNGRVMVEIPRCYVKSANPSSNVYRFWISSNPKPGFTVHPAFRQGGDGTAHYASNLYVGAYEADFIYDSANTHYELHSRTGKQPWTGSTITEINFDGGFNEPAIEDSVSTSSSDADTLWSIVDYVKTAGDWANSTAAGKIWVRQTAEVSCGFTDNENINNDTQGNVLAGYDAATGVNGAVSALHLDMAEIRTYAQNIGADWEMWNYWSLSLIRLLYYMEYASANSQDTSAGIGKGVVDKATGIGFDGELTGHDSIDTNVADNGTGTGTGTDGLTPMAYRGIENLWGNAWQYVDGYNAVNGTTPATDVKYRVLKRDGTSTFADALVAYDESSNLTNPSDGYQTNWLYETTYALALLPSVTAGTDSTYLYDYFWVHDENETNVLLFGGHWSGSVAAGVGYLFSDHEASYSDRKHGARLEFLKP